ncbi:MAG: hypothetical protein DMG06_28030 [Acidobacteria bacterium]|nr:MAG: hypothetical protein DMG06_28030 [Acidobacteriota bacterium]
MVSTLFVFVSTWFLHAYQWFWLRGSFLLAWQDVSFWIMLGLLVVINSVYEAKHGRERSLTRSSLSFHRFAAVSLRTFLTFSVICVLWSLWTSESVSAWISLWTVADQSPSFTAGTIPLFFVLGVVVSGTVREIAGNNSRNARQPAAAIGGSALISLACLALLCLLGVQEMHTQFGPKVATVINSLRSGKLSRLDNAMLERGYYEQLMQVDRFNSQLWEVYMNKPLNWLDVRGTGLEKFTGDFKQKELLPSFVAITSHGPIRTNRWGMRDQDYEKQPAPGTFRVALLGASSVMGWGVQDSETFESLLEERLNRENSKGPYAKYEILNFAVPGYQPLQQVMTLENAFSFQPSAVFYVAAGREAQRCSVYLAEVIRKRIYVPYEYLREIARKARIEATMGETEAVRRLEPFGAEMLAWVYRGIVQNCRERGIVPVWVFLPTPLEDPWQEDTASLLRAAEESGFIVLNLVDVYRNHDIKALRFAEWDAHPNAQAHKLIADKLYDLLWERKKDILLSFGSGQIGQGK